MGQQFDTIPSDLADWLGAQPMFFVATAPLSSEGLVNCSPKGMDSFRVVSPTEVAYLDLTGSGIETAAHLGENGRIVLMFCAFGGAPRIVRLHGNGKFVVPHQAGFAELRRLFPEHPGIRGVVCVRPTRISDSCGYAVPRFKYVGERETLVRWAESKGPEGLARYRSEKNRRSLDGLPGLSPEADR